MSVEIIARDSAAIRRYKAEHPSCEVCGWTFNVECHHLLPVMYGGGNEDDNLMSVCPNHHAMAHSGWLKYAGGSARHDRTIDWRPLGFSSFRAAFLNYARVETPITVNVLAQVAKRVRRRRRTAEEKEWRRLSQREQTARLHQSMQRYEAVCKSGGGI